MTGVACCCCNRSRFFAMVRVNRRDVGTLIHPAFGNTRVRRPAMRIRTFCISCCDLRKPLHTSIADNLAVGSITKMTREMHRVLVCQFRYSDRGVIYDPSKLATAQHSGLFWQIVQHTHTCTGGNTLKYHSRALDCTVHAHLYRVIYSKNHLCASISKLTGGHSRVTDRSLAFWLWFGQHF